MVRRKRPPGTGGVPSWVVRWRGGSGVGNTDVRGRFAQDGLGGVGLRCGAGFRRRLILFGRGSPPGTGGVPRSGVPRGGVPGGVLAFEFEENFAGVEGDFSGAAGEGECFGVGGAAGEIGFVVVVFGDDACGGINDGGGTRGDVETDVAGVGGLDGIQPNGDVWARHPEGEGLDGRVRTLGDVHHGCFGAREIVDDFGGDLFGRIEGERADGGRGFGDAGREEAGLGDGVVDVCGGGSGRGVRGEFEVRASSGGGAGGVGRVVVVPECECGHVNPLGAWCAGTPERRGGSRD